MNLKHLKLKEDIIKVVKKLCKNMIIVEEKYCYLLASDSDELGQSFVALADYERELYSEYLLEGADGLTTAQVSLQRLAMTEKELKLERLIDAADRFYICIFDEVAIPDFSYIIKSKKDAGVTRLVLKEDFLELNNHVELFEKS